MSNEKAIVQFNPDTGFEFSNIDEMFRAAECYIQSGFAPRGFDSAQKLVICWARAAELGVRPLQAVDGMSVINGKLGIGGDMALALVRSKGLLVSSPLVTYKGEGDALTCTVELHRKGDDEPRAYSFSVAEAKAANIYQRSEPWKAYPKRMTYYRALGFGLRDLFSDVLKGMKTSEELHDYPDLLESDKQKVAYNRIREAEAKASGKEKFVTPKPDSVRPSPEEAVEPAFEADKKPDKPPFAEKLTQEFGTQKWPPQEEVKTAAQEPDEIDMVPVVDAQPETKPEEASPARPEWMDHVIRSISHPRFAGKKIGELPATDLLKVETQWVPKIEADMDNASADQKLEYRLFQSAIAHGKMAK
jgi:hypothetical protein